MGNKYTFDNLVNMVVKAVRDRQLDRMELSEHSVSFTARVTTVDGSRFEHFVVGVDSVEEAIVQYVKFIESLYIETFVIENECDCEKFKGVVESLVLSNGEDIIDDVKFHRNHPYFTTDMMGVYKLPFKLLKGATVTQIKGDK